MEARKNGQSKGLVVMASGLGKTLTAAFDLENFFETYPDARVLYLCHQENILSQAKRKFREVFGEEYSYGIYTGNYKTTHSVNFLFATFQTMRDYREKFAPDVFDYIIIDEAHHTAAETYQPTVDYFRPRFLLGLTATKDRMDGQDILNTYGEILYEMDLYDGWEAGWLARVDYRIMLDDLNEAEFEKYLSPDAIGEKVSLAQLNKTIFAPQRDEDIVKSIREQTSDIENPRIFVFCSSIWHANKMAEQFAGEAAVIHSLQAPDTNEAILSEFRSGGLSIVISVNMLNEGVDAPEADAVVFLRATESTTIFFQQLGRGLRLAEGKRTVRVLDYVANLERISMILEMEETVKRRLKSPSTSTPSDKPEPLTVNIPATKFEVQKVDIEKILRNVKRAPILWSDEDMLQLFKQKAKELGHTPRAVDLNEDPSMPSQGAYIAHFGSLQQVARLCELIPNIGAYEEYSDEELLEMLRQKASDGIMPTTTEVANDSQMPPLSVYYGRFGPWASIAKRVGLKLTRISRGRVTKKTRDELISILKNEAKKLNGKPPSRTYMYSQPDLPAPDAFITEFGSWNAALKAANLKPNQEVISDKQALQALRDKAKILGRAPTRTEVDEDDTMLSSTSYGNRFGTFIKALDEAGIKISTRSGWKRSEQGQRELEQEMLCKLHELTEALGRDPVQADINRADNLPSASTYRRHFGSIQHAVDLARNIRKKNS